MSPPPTNIDGTDITGATIDGTEVTEITIDGQTVFTAGADIPDSGNLVHRYAASELNLSNNDAVNPYPDEVGTEDLDGAGPTFVTDGINGNESVRYDNIDDRHTAQTKSAYNFLHDGTTAYSCYIVVEVFGSGGLTTPMSTQGVFGSNQRGASLNRDDRGSFDDIARFYVSNGSQEVIDISVSNAFPANSPKIFSIHFDGNNTYRLFSSKSQIGSQTGSNQSLSNSFVNFQRGLPETNFGVEFPLNGDVGSDLYYQVEHDPSTRESVIDYLGNEFGITV